MVRTTGASFSYFIWQLEGKKNDDYGQKDRRLARLEDIIEHAR